MGRNYLGNTARGYLPTTFGETELFVSAATQTTLSVVLNDSADPVFVGGSYNYTIDVSNTDVVDANNVSAVLTLDPQSTFVSGSGSGWTVVNSSGVVTCTRSSLANLSSAPTITISVTASASAETSSASVAASATNAAQVTDTETTVVNPYAVLTVTLDDSADPVNVSTNYDYTITVNNTSATTASSISAALTLDPQSTYVSGSGTGWSVSQSGGVVTCTRSSLAGSSTAPVITVTVTSAAASETSSASVSVTASNTASAVTDTETTVVSYSGNKDATKGWARPQNAAAWTSLLAGTGIANPNSSWDCTVASGNLTDQIGSLTLTASVTPNYHVAATGWAGTGVDFTDNTSDGFRAASGTGPSPATTSQVWLVVASIETEPTAARQFFGCSGNSIAAAFAPAAGTNKLQIQCQGVNTAGSSDHSTGSYVFSLRYDRAASAAKVSSDLETVAGTYSSSAVDGNKGIGHGTTSPGGITVLLVALWTGANAESLSDANISTIRSRIKSPA